MMPLILHGFVLAPTPGAWLHGAVMAALAWRRQRAYDSNVPEKEGTGLGRPNKGAHRPRNAAFLCAIAFVRLQWAAVAGKPKGLPVPSCRSSNPAICRSPRLDAGRGSTAQEGGHHA